jgi:succinoglycan biosynthesis protein ExoV
MRLIYFAGHGNFGDELNDLLWPRLAPDLFEEADRTGFLGIGTIIGMPTPNCDRLHVFSSGVGYDRLSDWNVARRIWCVRGPLTARLLEVDTGRILTDGAILTPCVVTDAGTKPTKTTISVMPHWESLHYPGWHEACALAGFRLISPIGEPETVIRALQQTHLLITESLHGAIIADTYGIPWIPMRTSRNFSVFKWMDWCLSMQVPLSAAMVPPPSAEALLRFGRLPIGSWGERIALSPEDAMAEFNARVGVGQLQPIAASPHRWVLGYLRSMLTRSDYAGTLLRLARVYRPERTAAYLVRTAGTDPTLSREALRSSLRDQMMERLRELSNVTVREPAA